MDTLLADNARSRAGTFFRGLSLSRALILGVYIGFLVLALLYPNDFWGSDFFQHFSPPEDLAYPYAYPGWVRVLFSPLAALGPYLSFVVFLLFTAILLAVVVYREGMLWVLVWPVTLYGLWEGNLVTLAFVGALAGYRWWKEARYSPALAPWALVLLKPHLALGFLLWVGSEIWGRRMLRAGALALLGIMAYGLLSLGSGLPGSSYWGDWFLVQGFSPLSLLPPILKIILWAGGLLLLGIWLWRNRENKIAFALAWAAGVLITPYFQVQDLLFFAPALTFLTEKNKMWWLGVLILGIVPWVNVVLIPVAATIVVLGLFYVARQDRALGGKT